MTDEKQARFYVGEINFFDEVRADMALPKRVYVTDETLREGEEAPGVVFTVDDKVEMAKMLEDIGVYETNVGYVNYIEEHAEAAKRVIKACPKLKTSCYIRAFARKDIREEMKREVEFALELGVHQIGILTPVSDYQLTARGLSKGRVRDDSVAAVEVAKKCGASVTYAPYDTTRTEFNYLKTLLKDTVQAGADRVLVYDTLGVLNPQATLYWMREIRKTVNVPIQYHCHTDFNLAVANT